MLAMIAPSSVIKLLYMIASLPWLSVTLSWQC
jgi:hypothetical protein